MWTFCELLDENPVETPQWHWCHWSTLHSEIVAFCPCAIRANNYLCFLKTLAMPLSVSAHWPSQSETLAYPTAFISGRLAEGQPLNSDALNETFCQRPAPVFPQTERAVRQPVFGFIDKGGFVGKESYTIPLGALSNTNDLLASETLEWKTKIQESGSLRGKKKQRGAWIRQGNEKSKSEDHAAETGQPAFIWMINSWKSLERERI